MDPATAVTARATGRTASALASILLATLVTLALDAVPAGAAPGDIDTVIGGPGFGPAREVTMFGQMAARGNRLYVADERLIRLVDLDSGIATIFAGTGAFGNRGDGGPAELAEFIYLQDVALDAAGNVFVADDGGGRIRRIDAGTGIVSTVAGGEGCYLMEGCSVLETFIRPSRLAIDSTGNLYFADGYSVFRIDSGSDQAVHVAGNGYPWFGGDGGPATMASLVPFELTVDASDILLIADAENGRIRRVDSTTGIITTVAGNDDLDQEPSEGRLATDVHLASMYALAPAADGGFLVYGRTNTLWHVDPLSGALRRVAGNGSPETSGDGGPATDAGVAFTAYLATNEASDVFLGDVDHQIRRVSGETGIISTVAGTGDRLPDDDGRPANSIQLVEPRALAVDAHGNLLVADVRMVRRMDAATGTIETLAGGREVGSTGDGGPARAARFREIAGIAVDASGNVYVSDVADRRVRRIDAATGIIETIAGAGTGGDGGPALTARLSIPRGLALDRSGGLLIADSGARRVRRIDLATGLISTIAGGPQFGEPVDGVPATISPLVGPSAIDVATNGDVYLSDGTEILRIDATTGVLFIIPIARDGQQASSFSGIRLTSSGYLFAAQPSRDQVVRVDLLRGEVVRVAGGAVAPPAPGTRFAGDGGPALDARLYTPSAVALDASGNLLIADRNHARVRRVEATPLCGDGVLGSGETCDDGNRTAGDCCSPTCQIESVVTVCRPAVGPCDVAETCDGSSATCPADTGVADGDADGECDVVDPCTNVGGRQHFVSPPRARVVLTRFDTTSSDDTMKISARFTLPEGRRFADLLPLVDGARVVIEGADGTRALDATLPPGAYSAATRSGWTTSRSGKAWTFVDRRGTANGIVKLVVTDRDRRTSPRRVQVVVTGKNGLYPVTQGDLPVQVILALGDAADAAAGMCGESAYRAGSCVFNGAGSRLVCRQ